MKSSGLTESKEDDVEYTGGRAMCIIVGGYLSSDVSMGQPRSGGTTGGFEMSAKKYLIIQRAARGFGAWAIICTDCVLGQCTWITRFDNLEIYGYSATAYGFPTRCELKQSTFQGSLCVHLLWLQTKVPIDSNSLAIRHHPEAPENNRNTSISSNLRSLLRSRSS